MPRRWIAVLTALALALGPVVMGIVMAAPMGPQSMAMSDDGAPAPMPCCPDNDAATMPTMVCGVTCPAASILPAAVTIRPAALSGVEQPTPPVILASRAVPPDPFPPKDFR